jgi:hypothetical protein
MVGPVGERPWYTRRVAVAMHFTPRDQIVLLAGLEGDDVRERIWSLPELRESVQRLVDAGLLIEGRTAGQACGSEEQHDWPSGLSDPAGVSAARRLRHITLADLVAEHLPDRS